MGALLQVLVRDLKVAQEPDCISARFATFTEGDTSSPPS
jgi:hypothetical protein